MAEMVTKLCRGCGLIKPAWKSRSSYCTDCCKEHNRAWSERNKNKVKERDHKRNQTAPRRRQISTQRKIKRRVDPAFRETEIRSSRRTKLYRMGLSEAAYASMATAQNGCCAICDAAVGHERMGRIASLAVDHDHATGAIRELLCIRCNTGIGSFGDNPYLMWRAIRYLVKHGRQWD